MVHSNLQRVWWRSRRPFYGELRHTCSITFNAFPKPHYEANSYICFVMKVWQSIEIYMYVCIYLQEDNLVKVAKVFLTFSNIQTTNCRNQM